MWVRKRIWKTLSALALFFALWFLYTSEQFASCLTYHQNSLNSCYFSELFKLPSCGWCVHDCFFIIQLTSVQRYERFLYWIFFCPYTEFHWQDLLYLKPDSRAAAISSKNQFKLISLSIHLEQCQCGNSYRNLPHKSFSQLPKFLMLNFFWAHSHGSYF